MTGSIIEWLRNGKATVLGMITGAVAGLVAITPASGSVSPMDALGVGAGAGIFCYIFVTVIKPALGYDDSLDVFGVHGIGGIWSAIAAGLWATAAVPENDTNGLFYSNPGQVVIQIKAVVLTIVWSGVISFVLLRIVDTTVGLKATEHDEHAETAYTLVDRGGGWETRDEAGNRGPSISAKMKRARVGRTKRFGCHWIDPKERRHKIHRRTDPTRPARRSAG